MKETVVNHQLQSRIHDVDIPKPAPGQVLIKVVVSGSNPKDWKYPKFALPKSIYGNYGDDIAGYVAAVGEDVLEFKPGDKVAAFHEVRAPHGSWAEYAIAPGLSTFHLPEKISFEEASTIPLAAGTAAVGLYQRLGLPLPWNPATTAIPLVIYGGATSVGAFAIKLARLSNIHPIITVAGNGIPFVETLIDTTKGDTVVDYRHGDEAVRAEIRKAAGNNPIAYAFDAVSEGGSVENIFDVLEKNSSKVATVLPVDQDKIPSGIEHVFTYVGTVHKAPSQPGAVLGDAEFGHVLYRFLARGLAQGWFSGHPYEVVPGGLNGVEAVLKNLESGKASAVKYVVRIAETAGISEPSRNQVNE